MTDTTENTEVALDHADASILESWNAIRAGDPEKEDPTSSNPGEDSKPATQARDASGKFAKAADEVVDQTAVQKDAEVDALTAAGQGDQPQEVIKSVSDSPKSMPKDLADRHWSALPPEVQAWTQKRDADYEAGISRYRAAAEAHGRIEAAFAPYQETLQRLGAQPEQAIGQLLGVDHILRHGQPAEKAAMLVQLAQQFGVPLEHLPQVSPVHQQMLAQAQKVHGYESQQTVSERMQAQRSLDTLTSEVMKFSEGKEHFGAVEQEMLALLPRVAAQFPDASAQEKLQRAYDIAIYANPTTRAALEAQQREAQAAAARQKASEAKKAAATNRTPRGNVATAAAVGSLEDTIRAKAAELGLA